MRSATGSHPAARPAPVSFLPDRNGQARTEEDEAAKLLRNIELLDSRLREAIQEEEYEAAARYRDEIRELKERLSEHA